MKIMPNRMDRGFYRYQEEFEQKAVEVLRSGWYVLGREVSSFEEEFAAYTYIGNIEFKAGVVQCEWCHSCFRRTG